MPANRACPIVHPSPGPCQRSVAKNSDTVDAWMPLQVYLSEAGNEVPRAPAEWQQVRPIDFPTPGRLTQNQLAVAPHQHAGALWLLAPGGEQRQQCLQPIDQGL